MLAGKTALITGASRGIGRAIAIRLAQNGANVVINYLKSEREATELASRLQADYGVRALPCGADVADEEAVKAMINTVISQLGDIDILINNAGQVLPQYWREITREVWGRTLDINLYGALSCIRATVGSMQKCASGRIVNIASTYGITGSQYVPAYAISKAGLITLTVSLAKDLAPSITVNAIAPGNIDTTMTTNAGEAFVSQVIDQTPLKRLGTAAEVADAVLYLCSPTGGFITGQVLILDGGYILR